MKKILSLLLAAYMLFVPLTSFAEPDNGNSGSSDRIVSEASELTPPDVSHAESALLMDMKTGRVLYGKNIDERLFPASTTKMMTGILALESDSMNDTVTATYEAIKDITLQDSHMGILIGEELTMEQLVSGMLVYSANDAANVIAIHLAGSIEAFADKMNAKAQELGMQNTHFVNACGIHDDNHYTTAEDLAILAQYCMKNERFREIVKTPIYKMPATNKYAQERALPNTNMFLSSTRSSYSYQPCIGIKTGHTDRAGYCLVSAAEYNEISLIAVVLKCNNKDTGSNAYSYIDSRNLFNYGFNNYVSKQIASPGDVIADSKVYEAKSDTRVALTVPENIYALVPSSADLGSDLSAETEIQQELLTAPIKKGTVLGKVVYSCGGAQLASADLVAANDVERDKILYIAHIVLKVLKNPLFFIPVILLIIIAFIARGQRKKRARKRKLQQLKRNKQRSAPDASRRMPDRNAAQTQQRDSQSKGSNSRYSGSRFE